LPGTANVDDWREAPKPEPADPADALVVARDPDPPEAQAFWRAARRGGIHGRLFEMDRRLEGFGWYDALPRMADIATEITVDGRTETLEAFNKRHRGGKPMPRRPESIRFLAAVETPGGGQSEIALPADLAFAGDDCCWIEDARPLVTPDSGIDPQTLADLLRNAYFSPSDDCEADSWETQLRDFERDALHLATRLLVSDDEARRRTIADTVARELFWLIPAGRGADIAVRGRDVAVKLFDLEPETEVESEPAPETGPGEGPQP